MYTLPDAVRLKDHVLERWEAADRKPALVEDGALNVVVVGGGPTGVETAGALAELYSGVFRKDYPDVAPGARADRARRGRSPDIFGMFKEDLRAYTQEALEKRGVEVLTGEVVESVAPKRVTLKSGTVLDAHTLVWGAGLQGNELDPLARPRARSAATASRSTTSCGSPTHPEVFAVGDIAAITDAKTRAGPAPARLGRAAVGRARGRDDRAAVAGKQPKPFEYQDKGTMATIGRGAAVVQMLGGKTMKGKKAQLAWGTVHLALLPTNQDRAKAVVDWAGAGLTHQRSGRIRVEA